jgi:hypothetical protein
VDGKSVLPGGWKDAVNYLHGANSWYFGYLWRNSGHLVDATSKLTINAHIDPFGPLNPLHYLLQIPSMLISPGSQTKGTCSLDDGCIP